MLKFKMADDDKCERCGETETKQHQLYECLYAKRMWRHYNKTMRRIGLSDIQINSLNQAIIPSKNGNYLSETMRVIVLKANIQIVRPKHNLPEVLDSLFSAQAKIENNVYNRKLSKANKRTKIGQKNSSLWYKLLISLGKS
jgi:Rad3-related DNA helicase